MLCGSYSFCLLLWFLGVLELIWRIELRVAAHQVQRWINGLTFCRYSMKSTQGDLKSSTSLRESTKTTYFLGLLSSQLYSRSVKCTSSALICILLYKIYSFWNTSFEIPVSFEEMHLKTHVWDFNVLAVHYCAISEQICGNSQVVWQVVGHMHCNWLHEVRKWCAK